MEIKLKYKFGDEVYVLLKEYDVVRVFKGKVKEFAVREKHEPVYYVDSLCDEFTEEELIPVDDKELLAAKIEELLKEC